MRDCKHLSYDSDGDYCEIGVGCGVNSHCRLKFADDHCMFYESKNKEDVSLDEDKDRPIGKFKNPEALLKAYQSLEKEFTRRSQKLRELEKSKIDFKIIAVDFDGTLCENKYPLIGKPNIDLINYLKKEIDNGSKVILWTCRSGSHLIEAIIWCEQQGLKISAANDNIKESVSLFGFNSRKIFAHVYIDDNNSTEFKLPFVKK